VAKDAGLPISNNPCPHINAELLLVSRMDYTMRILLCPLVLVVNIDDIVSSERFVVCKERQWKKEIHSVAILSTYYKCNLSAITYKLNVSGHMLIWTYFSCFGTWNSCQSLSAPFSYTILKS
jgi:hypothetical protein